MRAEGCTHAEVVLQREQCCTPCFRRELLCDKEMTDDSTLLTLRCYVCVSALASLFRCEEQGCEEGQPQECFG